jgi:hypothetical protein
MAKKKFVNIVFTNCPDPARREEFERWYVHMHLKDLKNTKGLVRARRFKNLNPDEEPSQTMTFYEFESDDWEASINELNNTAANAFVEGRHIDVFELKGLYQYEEIDPASLKPLEDEHPYKM